MEIYKTTNVSSNSQVKKKKNTTSDGSFANKLEDTQEANEAKAVNAVSSINSLFMLQEVNDDEHTKQDAVQNGFNALEYLESIRLGLLTGEVTKSTLVNLSDMIKKWRSNYDDPQLESIIDEIELRASVELAKLEVA